MTATLKELLTEYAEQARPYEVREQALRRGRRRRRMRVAAPALAVLSVFATGLTAVTLGPPVAPLFGPPEPSQPVDPWWPQHDWPTVPSLPPVVIEDLERVSLPDYPAEIVTDPDAPPLPTDGAVGRGLLVFPNTSAGWFGLVTESGAQYRLRSLSDNSTEALSLGGRWLVSYTATEFVQDGAAAGYQPTEMQLRDLAGTAVTTVPLEGNPGLWWSTDDRWLLTAVVTDAPNPPETATLIDLAQPTPVPREIDLRRWPGFGPAAVRNDGTVVLRAVGGDRLGDVVLVNPTTGDGRTVGIDLAAAAAPDELDVTAYMEDLRRLSGEVIPLHPLPDGSVLLQLWRSFGGSPNFGTVLSTDVLVLDLDAGVVRERWHLPEPRPIPGSPRGDWETWRVTALLPEGLLLTHSSTQRRWAWELYDPATGTLSLVTDLRGLASAKQD